MSVPEFAVGAESGLAVPPPPPELGRVVVTAPLVIEAAPGEFADFASPCAAGGALLVPESVYQMQNTLPTTSAIHVSVRFNG